MIEIEKNVPMPQSRGLSGRYPFGDMKVTHYKQPNAELTARPKAVAGSTTG